MPRYCQVIFPRYRQDLKRIVRDFIPHAGTHIRDRIVSKLGIYQPGWKNLADETLARKARRKLISGTTLRFKKIKRRAKAGIGDTPLVEFGKMSKSARSFTRSYNEAHVTVNSPAEIHEQDPDIEVIAKSRHTPPKRAFMGPAMEESIEPLARKLEESAAGQL
jgi:hypothetical protein